MSACMRAQFGRMACRPWMRTRGGRSCPGSVGPVRERRMDDEILAEEQDRGEINAVIADTVVATAVAPATVQRVANTIGIIFAFYLGQINSDSDGEENTRRAGAPQEVAARVLQCRGPLVF